MARSKEESTIRRLSRIKGKSSASTTEASLIDDDASSFTFPEVSFQFSPEDMNGGSHYAEDLKNECNSESIESSSSGNSSSSNSFGNRRIHRDDSFTGRVSNTGMSSDESSIHSHSSYNRFTGKHDMKYTHKPEGDDIYLKPKSTSRHLPILTVQSRRTKELLEAIPGRSLKKDSITPMSQETKQTEPSTPSTVRDEFPAQHSFSSTPKIHVSGRQETSIEYSSILSQSSSTTNSGRNDKTLLNKGYLKANAEKEYWKYKLKMILRYQGGNSKEAAKAFSDLGAVLMRCKEPVEALKLYKMSVSIYREIYGDENLIVARMLNQVGLSASLCQSDENLDWALIALKEALHIRMKFYGPHHVDVVDTLNNIAGVYFHKRELDIAKELYLDVLLVRNYIFGRNHPSVAVTAQTLGKVYTRLADFHNAMKYFELALEIFQGDEMKLSSHHPIVVKVKEELMQVDKMMIYGI